MESSISASCNKTAFPITKTRRLTRLPGAATGEGPEFEFKLSGLLALRAFTKGLHFELFSNVEVARPLDDLVIRLVGPSELLPSPFIFFVQLKHSRPGVKCKTLKEEAFTSDKGDYSVRKYMEWFSELHRQRETGVYSDLLSNTSLENVRLAIFTTKDAVPSVRQRQSNASSAKEKSFPFEEIFYTSKDKGDDAFTFDASYPKVWNLFEGDDRNDLYQATFLPSLKVFCNQVFSGELDEMIEEELVEVFGKYAKTFLQPFLKSLKVWSENNNNDYCLSNEVLLDFFGQQLRRTALESLCQDLEFKPESLTDLRTALRNATSLLRVTMKEVEEPGLRAAKVLQAARAEFGDDAWLYMNDSIFQGFKTEVLKAAAASAKVVIVDVQRPEVVGLAKAVVESLGNEVLQVSLGKANVYGFQDIWRLRDLEVEAQKMMLEQTINFQEI